MKSGFVSIIGRPNVGKSSILNCIINNHVAIVSPRAGTTRNIIEGIYNTSDTQIVFVDTPGISKPLNKLGVVLNKKSGSLTKDVDVIMFVVDGISGLGKGDKYILKTLSNDIPVILVINKIDGLKKEVLLDRINSYKDLFNFADIVPVSAKRKENIDTLINVLKKYLTDDIKYFNDDVITTSSIYFQISELVREKLFNYLDEEIPHSLTCVVTNYEEEKDIININVDIIIDRKPLKKIIIGKNGSMLKKVGTEARLDIEKLLNKKVYLGLYVKTVKNWRDKENFLKNSGLIDE